MSEREERTFSADPLVSVGLPVRRISMKHGKRISNSLLGSNSRWLMSIDSRRSCAVLIFWLMSVKATSQLAELDGTT